MILQTKFNKCVRKLLRSQAGTSMVEFALVAPVLIFLLIGLIEVGRYTYFGILAANAARAGVQYGAQSLNTAQDKTGMANAAVADAQGLANWTATNGGVTAQYLCSQNGAVAASCGTATPAPGTVYYVKVTVTGTFKSLLNYPGIPNGVPISATAMMRVISQ
jgi:Flp pilus assembly protein TadG